MFLRMYEPPASVRLIQELETRQDEALRQLAELEGRIERVLAECSSFLSGRPKLIPLPIPVGVLPLSAVAADVTAGPSIAATA